MMWWLIIILVWIAAGISGFIALLIEAYNNLGKTEDGIKELNLVAFAFFAIIGPFVWLIVWRYDVSQKRHK